MEFRVLTDILDNLPVMNIGGKDFQPVFDYGTQADLLKFLKFKNAKGGKNVYPLVWIQTPVTFEQVGQFETAEINMILATITNRNITNRVRTEITFLGTLDPLLKNVYAAINAHETTRMVEGATATRKFFNYENDEEKGATDIWDAIQFTFTIHFNLNCINY